MCASMFRKIRRISFEIIEKNYDENEIFLVGILPNGKYLSNKITEFLNDFSEKKLNVHFLEIDKKSNYVNKITPEVNSKLIKNKVVIIIDDVMNSGSTIMYSISELLKYKPKKIQNVQKMSQNTPRIVPTLSKKIQNNSNIVKQETKMFKQNLKKFKKCPKHVQQM